MELAIDRPGTRAQCHALSGLHERRGLLDHPSSHDRHHVRDARRHRLAQDLLLCADEPGPSTRLFGRGNRHRLTGSLPRLSIPSQHHPRQSFVLLVGADASLSAALSPVRPYPMGIPGQTSGRDGRTQHVHLDRIGAVRGAVAAELAGQGPGAGVYLHRRADHEALDHLARRLAGRILCAIPFLSQRARRDHAIRRSRILHGLVEQPQRGCLLAHLEQARLLLYEATHLFALGGPGLAVSQRQRHGVSVVGHLA